MESNRGRQVAEIEPAQVEGNGDGRSPVDSIGERVRALRTARGLGVRELARRVDITGSMLSQIERDYRVDPERIYVTGLSMGGYGTWELALSAPHRFAALAPICGGGSPGRARWIAHLPIWVFHGAKDTTVPVRRSKEMVQALERAGGSPRLTIYPTAKHDSWTETYSNPELYEWLLSHRRRASTG